MHVSATRDEDARSLYPRDDIGSHSHYAGYRTPYTRDRDRIVFSKGFRRLADKTQVYLSTAEDAHLRTRLTHVLEVAQIAKTISRKLEVNTDLVEAIAFGHDIGHAPFGHAGERQLDDFLNGRTPLPDEASTSFKDVSALVRHYGDFRHNYQGLRLLATIELHNANHAGFNITYQCLEGIVKHTKIRSITRSGDLCDYPETAIYKEHLHLEVPWPTSVEGQIVAVADEIAQLAHDLNDAMNLDVITPKELVGVAENDLKVKLSALIPERPRETRSCASRRDAEIAHARMLSTLVDAFVRQTADVFSAKLADPDVVVDGHVACWLTGQGGDVPSEEFKKLKKFKDDVVINCYAVNRMDNRGRFLLRQLMRAYLSDPRQLPDSALCGYIRKKMDDAKEHDEAWFLEEFGSSEDTYAIARDSILTAEEKRDIRATLLEDAAAMLRRLPFRTLRKLIPYLIVDRDYRRAIADHVAWMTDLFAEREHERLYR